MASQEIIVFLTQEIAKGSSPDTAKAAALSNGWNKEDINGAYAIYAIRNGGFAPGRGVQETLPYSAIAIPQNHRIALVPIIIILGSLATVAYGYYHDVVLSSIKASIQNVGTTTVPTTKNQLFVRAYEPSPITATSPNIFPTRSITPNHYTGSLSGTQQTTNTQTTAPSSPIAITGLSVAPTVTTPVVPPPVVPPIPVAIVPTPSPFPTPVPIPVPPVPDPLPAPIDPIVPVLPPPVPQPIPVLPPPIVPPVATTSSTTPPVIPPPAPVPVVIAGSYETYPGCEAPASTYLRTIYINPVSGSETTGDGSVSAPYHTLAEAFADQKIKPGDKVELMAGNHGVVYVDTTRREHYYPLGTTQWLWINFEPGATAQSFDLRSVSRVLVTNAYITKGFFVSNGSNAILANSTVSGTQNPSSWTAADWIAAPGGTSATDNICTSFINNKINNTRFAMGVSTRAASTEASRVKNLIKNNVIRNFSGDGIRPNASDVSVIGNAMYDEYVSAADGDGNHDDAMQMFAPVGVPFDNVDIENNYIQESTNPNRQFNAPLQGIDIFDGVVTHVIVKNNVILNSSYYGISLFGVHDSVIANNTIVNSSTNGRSLRCTIPPLKDGTPPVNSIIKNNIVIGGLINLPGTGVTYSNNYAAGVDPSTVFTTFDRTTGTYDVHVKSGSAIDGIGVGAFPTGPVAVTTPIPHTSNAYALLASVGNGFSFIWNGIIAFIALLFGQKI
jgi:parallel beta-helix repeat protein